MKSRRHREEKNRGTQRKIGDILRRWIIRHSYLIAIFGFFMICVMFWGINEGLLKARKVTYVQQSVPSSDSGDDLSDMEFHFYLDFSPSMKGFMWKEINSNMAVLADALKKFDYLGIEQTLYWCDDTITKVGAEDFYESMSGTQKFDDHNNFRYASAEDGIQDQMEQMIRDIDLSDVFNRRYEDGMVYSEEKRDMNVIITDLNFKKENDEQSQEELSRRFADGIAEAARNSNVSIYQIYSKFAGEDIDAIRLEEEIPDTIEDRALYVIILSGNDELYQSFTGHLEQELGEHGVDVSHKFELFNRVGDRYLMVNQKNLLAMNLIENKNLNFDNESFKNLEFNAMGMRLVKGQGNSLLNMCVAPLDIPGYYDSGTTDLGELEVKVRLYRPIGGNQYEEDRETELIRTQAAGLEWVQEQLYLRFRLELDGEAITSEKVSFADRWKHMFTGRFFVLDIQFFMEQPSYVLPVWTEEEELNVQDIFQGIAERKAAGYAELDESSRYLGSMVIYVMY